MLTKNVDAVHGGTSEQYAADLVAEIKVFSATLDFMQNASADQLPEQNGAFSSLTTEWLSCTSTTEPVNNKRDTPSIERDVRALLDARSTETVIPLECPLVWARESNSFDCVSDCSRIRSRLQHSYTLSHCVVDCVQLRARRES